MKRTDTSPIKMFDGSAWATSQAARTTAKKARAAGHPLRVPSLARISAMWRRNAINAACVQARVPLVSGAAIRFEGQVASFSMQGDDACYHCLSQLFGEQQLSCMEAGILSPLVGIVGSMQALEAVKILAGVGTPLYGKLQLFDALTCQWRQLSLNKDPLCSVCATPAPATKTE